VKFLAAFLLSLLLTLRAFEGFFFLPGLPSSLLAFGAVSTSLDLIRRCALGSSQPSRHFSY
jgi:hypothetical protein